MSQTFSRSVDFLEMLFEQRLKFAHLLLQGAEKSTKVSKRRLVQLLLIINIVTLALCCWSKVTKLAILYFYPVRGTFICLQEGNPEEAVRWLMYWIVFGSIQCFFGFIEQFIGFLSLFNYILVIWSFLPVKYNGTNIIYKKIIRPLHQQLLNTSIDSLGVAFIEYLTKSLKLKKRKKDKKEEPDKSLTLTKPVRKPKKQKINEIFMDNEETEQINELNSEFE